MKKLLGLLGVGLLGFSLAGCTIDVGGDESTKESTPGLDITGDEELKGDVKIALSQTGGKEKILKKVIAEYEKERPGVNVEVEWKTSDDFYLGYQVDISAGLVYPDAAMIDHVYVQTLAGQNLITPIDTVLNSVEDVYIDNLTKATEYNGLNYGFPFSANTMCLYYNKDLLGDKKVPTTYEEFIEVGEQIYNEQQALPEDERSDVFSLSTGASYKAYGALQFTSWLDRVGGKLLSDDLRNANLNTPEVINILTKWHDICKRGWANPTLSNEGKFYNGRVAFLEMGCWQIPILFNDSARFNCGVAPLFSLDESGKNSSALGLYSLCVTKQKDENRMKLAADLCKYISTNTEAQVEYAKDSKCLPVTKEAAKDEFFQQPVWKTFVDALPGAARRPGSPEWPAIQDTVANMFMKVVYKNEDEAKMAKWANGVVQGKLDEFYEF